MGLASQKNRRKKRLKLMADNYIFLDRDGVINKDPGDFTECGYVAKWEDFYILPGVLEALKKFYNSGYKVIILSNQQGVGKGYFTQKDLDEITLRLSKTVEVFGGKIDGAYYCTHLKEAKCQCRKPKSGLFVQAKRDFDLKELEGYFYVGDTERDIIAGRNAGLNTILVLTGKTARDDASTWENRPDHICENMIEVSELVINGSHNG
jgi:D-glycero-D-manno-heptose 1,7-bisphosphate phosphatase